MKSRNDITIYAWLPFVKVIPSGRLSGSLGFSGLVQMNPTAQTMARGHPPEMNKGFAATRLQGARRKSNGNSYKSILRTAPTLSTSSSSSSLVHLFDAHPGSRTPIRKRAKRKRSLTQTISFSPRFIRNDAMEYFDQTWRQTLSAWESLLRKTMIPPIVPVTNLNVSTAVNALNNVIAGREGEVLPSGFGYVQLSRFLDALEGRVKADRKVGLIPSISGRVNASLAIDIYLGAQGAGPAALSTRSKVSECKRIGGRWEELVGPSVFLLVIYSNVAETFVYVVSYILVGSGLTN